MLASYTSTATVIVGSEVLFSLDTLGVIRELGERPVWFLLSVGCTSRAQASGLSVVYGACGVHSRLRWCTREG